MTELPIAEGTDPMILLLDIMRQLRDPDSGCPWDLRQDFHTIVPFTIEETYELADAIASGDFSQVCDELGDVLFQVVFYAQMASERRLFDFADVAEGIAQKLLRRHPHVFARSCDEPVSEAEVKERWETIKGEERQQKDQRGVLDDVPRALPALSRAQKLQKRAARVGFDWPDRAGVHDKIQEELAELAEAISEDDGGAIEAELGDVFLAMVNLARHLGVDAESAVRQANNRFESRFRVMEQAAAEDNSDLQHEALDRLEDRWQAAKRHLASK
ncbi:MAG: nucleoside triphosphate pyrophosphohydrolase [Halieaceae bacterium]|jgi:ATP diphosphatase|nr:nucleoside triphosphate pyrophosphohydrolase [Halieaceae bacterium]MDG2037801.1 nucleoside triphosphate pyrophosphohydrolase [Luminiphilus sp.]RZO81140.1 MAG: nucleoside triphosphate pyrophosphohydrolase [Halieaceae bacterium]